MISFGCFCPIFIARRYASAVYAIVLCLSVYLPVSPLQAGSRYCIETTGQIEMVCGVEASAILHCGIRKFGRSQKIRVLSSLSRWTWAGDFATASRSCYQQDSTSTVELVDHTYDGRRVVAGRT